MVTLLLELSLPFAFALAFVIVRLYLDVRRPVPRALGSVLPKFCVVNSDEILRYNNAQPAGEDGEQQKSIRRELRSKQTCVNWGYLRQMTWNTKLIQQVIRFEVMK